MVNINRTVSKYVPCYLLPGYKAYIIVILLGLTIYHLLLEIGGTHAILHLSQFLATVSVTAIIDGVIIRFRSKRWYFPTGAIISAMIISMIINPDDILITVAVVIISLVLKYAFRPNFRNVFNPAALAIVVGTLFLPVYSTWHGSVGISVFIFGLLLVVLIKRLSTALSFFLTFKFLNLGYDFLMAKLNVSLSLLTGPVTFFAFIMVIEPVTSPTTLRSKIIFGTGVAVLAFTFSFSDYLMGNSFFLYFGLLIMNLMMRVLPGRVLQ